MTRQGDLFPPVIQGVPVLLGRTNFYIAPSIAVSYAHAWGEVVSKNFVGNENLT